MRLALMFVTVVGLAVPASAQLVSVDPVDPRVGDRRADATAGGTARGLFNWDGILTMVDTFQGAPLGIFSTDAPAISFPETVVGPPGFDWGPNTLLGQTAFGADWASVLDLGAEPIGGDNMSRGVRLRTHTEQTPGGFYLGARHRWGVVMGPDDSTGARVEADLYATSLAQLYSFEPADTLFNGAISTRIMWGGDCERANPITGCHGLASDGNLNAFVFLSDCLLARCFGYRFWPGRFCTDRYGNPIAGCVPPSFAKIGDIARPQIGAWFRLGYEFTPDFRKRHLVDYYDGTGVHAFGFDSIVFTPYFNQITFNTGYEDADSRLYIDNIAASGPGGRLLDQPESVCPYEDDIDWLAPGLLDGQIQSAWFVYASPGSYDGPSVAQRFDGAAGDHAIVIDPEEVATGQVRRMFDAIGPEGILLAPSADIEVGVDLRHDNSRKREVALAGGVVANPYTVVTLGDSADPRIRVRRQSGPETFFNASWPADGEFHRLTIRVDAFRRVRVSIDGQTVGVALDAFTASEQPLFVRIVQFNAVLGGLFEVDNLTIDCDVPTCIADTNGDGQIDFDDLNTVLSSFGATGEPGSLAGDVNGDGVVNFTDLNAVLGAFGTTCD